MVELMPHQQDAVNSLSCGKILYGGVGTGKTITALAYYLKAEAPKNIYVITTAKKRDSLEWEGDAAKCGIGLSPGCTLHGVLTIDSWNNISKYVGVEDAFFIFDEQRVVGHGKWTMSFLKIARKNNWILLSATPGDTWLDYVPVFVANGLYKNVTQFKTEHVVYAPFSKFPRVVRYLNEGVLEKYRNMLLVEMPYIKHTVRVPERLMMSYDADLFRRVVKDRWHVYEERPISDVGELFRVMRKVVNSDPARLQAVRDLVDNHKKVIVYYNFDYELELLRTLSDYVLVAEYNGHRKHPIPSGDRWIYLVQYVAGAEGWNCIETDAMCFYSLTYSYKNFEQAQGRIDRLNTRFKELYYYILMSNSIIDRAIWRSLEGKKNFNENDWVDDLLLDAA